MIPANRFGLFIHWGIYALTGLHEQAFARYDLPRKEYEALADRFNPVNYNPEEWVLLAKQAGMKYICFTAKHHDGFCMWDTKYTDFNIMNTPYGKDVLKMLADACHKHGMLLSIYYSNPDWHHPNAFNPLSTHQWRALDPAQADMEAYKTFIKNQLSELLTNYGKIYTLFWDIPPHIEDRSLNEFARSLQPDICINNRGFDEGDFSTPEREEACEAHRSRYTHMTEACNSIDTLSWGFRSEPDFYSIRHLLSSIDTVMARGGNYLLNIGPMADGSLHPDHAARILQVGDWYRRMEGCLEEHLADPFPYEFSRASDDWIACRKNSKTYLHFPSGIISTGLCMKTYPALPRRVRLMNTGEPLPFCAEILPFGFNGTDNTNLYLHIRSLPTDELSAEPIVLEIDWGLCKNWN